MSVNSELTNIGKEIYNATSYEDLTDFEKEIVLNIYRLDEVINITDLILLKQDNIHEIKNNTYES